jgi:hypothetical protein
MPFQSSVEIEAELTGKFSDDENILPKFAGLINGCLRPTVDQDGIFTISILKR